MHFNVLLTLAVLFSGHVRSSPAEFAELEGRASVHRKKPTEDPFLNPPAGYESKKPGDILRHRRIANPAETYGDPAFGEAYQLLYRTTSSINRPEAAITTVFIPAKHLDRKKYLSYQIPYDAPDINCGPSYTLRKSSRKKFLQNSDLLLIKASLAQGWIVSTADYEGPHGEYTSGLQSGYATLDGLRAVLQSSNITGIHSDKEAVQRVLWGYSGGALASEWALELQPTYAPNLRIDGAALGGLTPNITSVFLTINKSLFAGLAAGGIVGLSRAYPKLHEYVDKHVLPSQKDTLFSVKHQCYFQDIKEFIFADITKLFDNGHAILTDPVPKSVIERTGIMGQRGVPAAPLYVYKAIKDEISPVADTDALVHEYCRKGVKITYDRNVVGEHVVEGQLGAPAALRFLRERLDGNAMHEGCRIQQVNTTRHLSPSDIPILGKVVYTALGKILKAEFKLVSL